MILTHEPTRCHLLVCRQRCVSRHSSPYPLLNTYTFLKCLFKNMHVRNSSLSSLRPRGLAIPACLISCNCARVVARPAGPSGRGVVVRVQVEARAPVARVSAERGSLTHHLAMIMPGCSSWAGSWWRGRKLARAHAIVEIFHSRLEAGAAKSHA